MPRAFVIRPFETKKDSAGKEIDFERVHEDLIGPALELTGFGSETTTGEIVDSGNIREDMFQAILEADLVICDITTHNANVFYELGIRHALRRKQTLLIRGRPTADNTPFDLLTDRYLSYDIDQPEATRSDLVGAIEATRRGDRETDSPVFKLLPSLPEAALSAVRLTPEDFREEVERACAAKSKGWLRLLSLEVRDRRFEWAGLSLVGDAQWSLRDYDGARKTWETIRDSYQRDIAANRALASIYGELYRDSGKPELREKSEQAIDRILEGNIASQRDRARALTVRADNAEIEWRLDLRRILDPGKLREQSITRTALDAYCTYHRAFLLDPSYIHAGLAALQMGEILSDLSREDTWSDAFDRDEDARVFSSKLAREVAVLRRFLPDLIDVELRQAAADTSEAIRGRIGRAQVLFFTEERAGRVVQAYKDAISRHHSVAHWDLARHRLELCADLGINSGLARRVIEAMESRFADQRRQATTNLVLFAGFRAGTSSLRDQEQRAIDAIRTALNQLTEQELKVEAFASASPGADIIFHEICHELGVHSTVCLPMPEEEFGGRVFSDLDDWKRRFRDLIDNKKLPVLELSDRAGLPNWLHGADVDPWKRGDQWLVQMALARDAEQVNLVTYWDGEEGHIASLARESAKIRIQPDPSMRR